MVHYLRRMRLALHRVTVREHPDESRTPGHDGIVMPFLLPKRAARVGLLFDRKNSASFAGATVGVSARE